MSCSQRNGLKQEAKAAAETVAGGTETVRATGRWRRIEGLDTELQMTD
jgi:hypothetical protein